MFDKLPETRPDRRPKRKKALVVSMVFHVVLVTAVILLQMFAPVNLAGVELLTTLYMAPPPPPPAPAAHEESANPEKPRAVPESPVPRVTPGPVEQPRPVPVEQPSLIAPVQVPKDVAELEEAAPSGTGGVIGGLPGSIPGGIAGGVLGGQLGGVLGGVANAPAASSAEGTRARGRRDQGTETHEDGTARLSGDCGQGAH